jgi:hypothetical protein
MPTGGLYTNYDPVGAASISAGAAITVAGLQLAFQREALKEQKAAIEANIEFADAATARYRRSVDEKTQDLEDFSNRNNNAALRYLQDQITSTKNFLQPGEDGRSMFDAVLEAQKEIAEFNKRNAIDPQTEANLREGMAMDSRLYAGDSADFQKFFADTITSNLANTEGAAVGTFANISQRNLYEFRERARQGALQVGDFFHTIGRVDPGLTFSGAESLANFEYKRAGDLANATTLSYLRRNDYRATTVEAQLAAERYQIEAGLAARGALTEIAGTGPLLAAQTFGSLGSNLLNIYGQYNQQRMMGAYMQQATQNSAASGAAFGTTGTPG